MKQSIWQVVPLLILGVVPHSDAETYYVTPDSYLGMLDHLLPGDELVLAAGEYQHGLPLHRRNGTEAKPIVISGPRAGKAVFFARKGANTVSIVDSSYITVRGLVLDGRGRRVDAVRAEGHSAWAHHIRLERLHIVNHDYGQQVSGISTKCPAWDWVIRDNVIERAGTGMYLGSSDGSAPFFRGVIEYNVIIESIGYNIQIKHQNQRPVVIPGAPQKISHTIIRHNVFSKTSNSAGGRMARPNLLVGHWPLSGTGSEDVYAIYGNFFYENPSEALFQGEGNVAFYDNILINTSGDAINIRPHNARPRRIDIFHNTILARDIGINIIGRHPAYPQRVVANAVFARKPIRGGMQVANVTGSLADAGVHLVNPFSSLDRLNVARRPGKLLTSPFEFEPAEMLPDARLDFEGRSYKRPTAGAYALETARWQLSLQRKRSHRDVPAALGKP